jgi:hypothetical protein
MTMLPEQRKQRVILLSRADAARVRGISRPGHALDPRQISEDQFILGLDVLEDPTHAIHISFLSTLPHCDIIQNPGGIRVVPGSISKPDNTPRIYRPIGNPWDIHRSRKRAIGRKALYMKAWVERLALGSLSRVCLPCSSRPF